MDSTAPILSFCPAADRIERVRNPPAPCGDSFFIRSHSIGMFDGGDRSASYAAELSALSQSFTLRPRATAKDALSYASRFSTQQGSSTACIAVLRGNVLKAASIGNSIFIVMRRGMVVFQATEMRHEFNRSFEIGRDVGGNYGALTEDMEFELQKNDIVIMASDGLWDNVFTNEVCETALGALCACAVSGMPRGLQSQSAERSEFYDYAIAANAICQALLRNALLASQKGSGNTPFAERAFRAGHTMLGGRLDDISIICAIVVSNQMEG